MAEEKKPTRDRGSIVDSVTMAVYKFQWEPEHKKVGSTKHGKVDIIGKRLPVRHWVGEGDSSVDLTIRLTGASNVNTDAVSSEEVGTLRYQQKIAAIRAERKGLPVVPADSVDEAKKRLRAAKKDQNKFVLKQIEALEKLRDPQEDTGAPHPVFLNLGGIYAGKKFIIESVEAEFVVHNYETMEPTEAVVKLKFLEVTDFRKK